jgi:hypothetical protein
MGFRKFLTRQSAEAEAGDLLERLAELGRADPPPPPFAPLKTPDETPPLSSAAVDKKAARMSAVVESKRAAQSPRRGSGYLWVSQRSREKRAAWASMPEKF